LEVVRSVKIHNLPIRHAALEFNMNYRALRDYCKKSWTCNYLSWNVWQLTSTIKLIVTFSQFHLKLN